jgi:hypothetical protein
MGRYWKCEFEGKNGESVVKTIFARTTRGAFKHTFEMGVRIGLEPKYETLREATDEEIKEFKKEIKKRLKKSAAT